jgi:hypothetical protein
MVRFSLFRLCLGPFCAAMTITLELQFSGSWNGKAWRLVGQPASGGNEALELPSIGRDFMLSLTHLHAPAVSMSTWKSRSIQTAAHTPRGSGEDRNGIIHSTLPPQPASLGTVGLPIHRLSEMGVGGVRCEAGESVPPAHGPCQPAEKMRRSATGAGNRLRQALSV